MKRYNSNKSMAISIHKDEWDNANLLTLLDRMTKLPDEITSKYIYIPVDNVTNELFKYSHCFDWISGTIRLCYNDTHVANRNYRTVIDEGDENTPPTYEYINWQEMTDIMLVGEDAEI